MSTEIERLREALQAIRDMTDADNPDSYRADDREGCLDAVFACASRALETPEEPVGAPDLASTESDVSASPG